MASSWREGGKNTPYDGRRKTKLIPYKKSYGKYEREDEVDEVDDMDGSMEDFSCDRVYNNGAKCLKL